jgi:glycosyltransferase involved in cell wall biosynthesis
MIAELDSRLRAAQCCIVVPTYNNAPFLPNFLKELAAVTHRVVIVNDGSTDNTAEILNQFQNDFHIVHLPKNRGKGMALRTAFKKAFEMGYQYAITIDSDGQHLISDLFMFLDKIEAEPGSMIVGARNMEQEGVPGKSSFGNRFSNFWYYVETFKKLPDTQSGYRLYPLEPISKMRFTTVKYEFEIEVLVRLAWKGVPVTHVPVSVIYHQDGSRISHFRPFKDFSRISVLNTVLVLIAFLYVHPVRFIRSLTWQNIKAFFNKHLFDTQESNAQLAKEMGFGFFMGIFPFGDTRCWQRCFCRI